MTASTSVRLGRGIKRALTENLGIKGFSLFASIWLFSLVHGAADEQRSIFVDVEVLKPPAESGRILVSELPERLRVTLRGSRSILSAIEPAAIVPVQIDLRNTALTYWFFDASSFDLPPGVTVQQLAPASIPLTWAEVVERRLPVEVNLVGRPTAGLALQEPIVVEPSHVLVRGPQSEIDPLGHVTTAIVDVSGLSQGRHTPQVLLARLPPHSSYVEETPVRLVLDVVPQVSERLLTRLLVSPLGGNVHAEVRPARIDLTLRGPPALVDGLEADRVVPYVEAAGLVQGAGDVSLPVRVRGLPEGVEVGSIDPPDVLVGLPRR